MYNTTSFWKYTLILIILLFHIVGFANNETDSILSVLDKTVKERGTYLQEKQQHIEKLKKELSLSTTDKDHFDIYGKLFNEYKRFQMDSALIIAEKRLSVAKKLKNENEVLLSEMNVAEIMSITGMYKEALDIMDKMNSSEFDKGTKAYYYHIYHSLYILMADYSITKDRKDYYDKQVYMYKDSILSLMNPDEPPYLLVQSSKLIMQNKPEEALQQAKKCYNILKPGDYTLAHAAYALAEAYQKLGNEEQVEKNLTISAIYDLKKCHKEYISLRKLAILLYNKGDIIRAYNYTKCSMEDAIFCNARFRTLEISQMLPIVSASYEMKVKQEKDNLIILLALISILSVVLVICILFIYKQLKKLSITRTSKNQMYEDLKLLNEELNQLNKMLSESNLVKEEYIGSIFNFCSTYIDKMEAYRVNINRKLRAGQVEDALKITSSNSLVPDELKEFFRNFDAIFLNLYPNFIEEFNTLLQKDEQIVPKAGDILTPELRIFALIRLGITDSSKIASFLHYSPQTVYNYKLKIRNKIRITKEDFSLAIQQIGK